MDRIKYKNKHKSEHYDRIELTVPKGDKDKIKEMSSALGISVNEYIYKLICEDLALSRSKVIETKFSDEDIKLLEKWQVARKYYEMIEQCSFSKETGYYVLLKQGYINDITGSRSIICHKTSELRMTVSKSHKVKEKVQVDGMDADMLEQLQKWQIPKKYYEMIESIGSNQITLKKGYINDFKGSRIITVEKVNEFKVIMKYTREE